MDWTLLLTIVIGFGLVSLVNYLAMRRFYERERRKLYKLVWDFVRPTGDDGASALARVVTGYLEVFAGKISASIKSTFMGIQSGVNRGEESVDLAVMQDSSPVLGAIMSSFPALRKVLRRNPNLAGYALDKVLSMAGKTGQDKSNGHEDKQSIMFDL